MSIRSGSQAAMSRGRLGSRPSTQSESELNVMNGCRRRASGRAFLTPPPVSSTAVAFVRNDDRGRVAPRAQMRLQHVGEVVHVDHHLLHAGLVQAVEGEVDERPAADLDQRLRHRRSERQHALAKTRGKHDG